MTSQHRDRQPVAAYQIRVHGHLAGRSCALSAACPAYRRSAEIADTKSRRIRPQVTPIRLRTTGHGE